MKPYLCKVGSSKVNFEKKKLNISYIIVTDIKVWGFRPPPLSGELEKYAGRAGMSEGGCMQAGGRQLKTMGGAHGYPPTS